MTAAEPTHHQHHLDRDILIQQFAPFCPSVASYRVPRFIYIIITIASPQLVFRWFAFLCARATSAENLLCSAGLGVCPFPIDCQCCCWLDAFLGRLSRLLTDQNLLRNERASVVVAVFVVGLSEEPLEEPLTAKSRFFLSEASTE